MPDALNTEFPAGSVNKPVVAIYRTQILPLSETFVRDQALALRRWQPILVGEREIFKLPLLGLKAASLYEGPPRLWQRVLSVAHRSLNTAPYRLTAQIKAKNARLIHAHFGFDGVEAWPIAKRLGVPLLVTLHGSDITTNMDWFRAGKAGRRWRSYPERLAKLAGNPRVHFVAVSENIRNAAIAAGLPAGRVSVHRIGIDPSSFTNQGLPIAQRPPSILFLGRLVEKKGAAFLLEAFEAIRQNLPAATLVIAGDGPERAALEMRAQSIGNVQFIGSYSHEQAQQLLAQARVLCLPSITAKSGDAEGLPIVILEAQAANVPVVTSARGGATEGIQDQYTGFAFPERDVKAMETRLLTLLTDDALATRFSLAGPDFIRKFHNLSVCTAGLERLYDEIVEAVA